MRRPIMISTRHLVRRIALTALVAGACSAAQAQGESATSIYNQSGLDGSSFVLSGTLAKVQREGRVTVAYRESSIPFSYLDVRGKPIGYSLELCKSLVQAMSVAVHKPLEIQWVPVTSATRFDAITSGKADLECGSTTNNLERQKSVAFSPTFFVAGTKLLVQKTSAVKDYRTLTGKKVAVTAGTTNEKTMRDLSERFQLGLQFDVMRDHGESFAQVASGADEAFAMDDVLLYGFIAKTPGGRGKYIVVGDFLSYDPYGIMYRKDDPAMTKLVTRTFQQMAADGEIERQYRRWFLRKLPSGETLNLPMSQQLETILESLAGTQTQ